MKASDKSTLAYMSDEQRKSKHKLIYFSLKDSNPFAVLNATPIEAISELIKWAGPDIEIKHIQYTRNTGYVDLNDVKENNNPY